MNACRALVAIAALVLAPTAALAQASPSPYTNATRYDAVGRVTGTIAPDPDIDGPLHHAAVRNTYDRIGRLITVETGELAAWQSETVAPASWANFTIYRTAETQYDAVGRKVRDTLRDGTGGVAGTVRSVTQYSYDDAGRLECTAIRMNPALFGTILPDPCTPGTAGSDGPDRITRNVYDAAGQRLQLREGVGTSAEGTEATWAHNLNGQVTTIIDGNGNRAELHYDGHGRQDRWTFPSATPPGQRPVAFDDSTPVTALATAGAINASLYEAYDYDPNGNRRFLTKRDGSLIEYQYDALNRVTLKIVPQRSTGAQALTAAQTRDVYYAYDLRNLQLSARFDSQSGEGVVNTYDGFGRLIRSIFDMGGISRQLDYRYDRNGNRTRITHADGNVFFGTAYDGANRPVQLGANDAVSLAYTNYTPYGAPALTLRVANQVATAQGYDGVLRPTVRVHYFTPGTSNAVWSYGFNAASQLSSSARDNDAFAWTNHYAVQRPYTTNGLNQYSAAGGATFLYDDNGNLTADPKRAFVYDIENRLVSATPLPGSDAVAAALVYDPLGRLFEVSSPTTGTRRFLYDGDALVAEYNGANQIAKRHVHWPGADLPMVTYEGSGLGTVRQLLADHQGSIVALADASGAAVQINRYDEYGIPGTGNDGTFQYTGQIWLSELGMYHYKARIYSPTLGRFMQTDPVGYEGGMNLYGYVGNDPVNGTDSTGLLADYILTWARGADRLVSIDDSLSASDQRMAEDTLMAAANLTLGMDLDGTLPADSRSALGALNSISVSDARAGLDLATGNFNMNIGEMRQANASVANQGDGAPRAAAAIAAGNGVHDGTHQLQNQNGQLPGNNFSSVPDGGRQRAAFDNMVVQSERAANAAQMNFYRAAPVPAHVSSSMVSALRNMTRGDILNRYHRR